MASIVISATLFALLGYALGLPGAYQWGQFSRIAPHTAAGLMILGGGLGYATWLLSLRAGESTPRWLPVPLSVGVLTGTLVLYFALDAKQNDEMALLVRNGATNVQRQVKLRMESRARSLTRLARRWEFAGTPTQAAWDFDASLYTQDFPDIQAVEWINPDGHIRWIVPVAGNEPKVNLDAAREARRASAMERSRSKHEAALSGAVALFRGGTGAIIYTPVQAANGEFEGWIAAVFEVQAFLDRYLPADVAADQAIRLSDQGKTFYTRADTTPYPVHAGWVAKEKIEMPGATWDVIAWPTPALAAKVISALPIIVLLIGVLDAALLAGICHLAQRHSRASRAHETTAMALQKALDEVKTLEGLLPICSCCKRVRDDTGYWNQIDTYLHRHTDAEFSHGYCPECAAKAFTEFGLAVPERIQAEIAAHNYE
jgi:sensor domain CHASE-containing protein